MIRPILSTERDERRTDPIQAGVFKVVQCVGAFSSGTTQQETTQLNVVREVEETASTPVPTTTTETNVSNTTTETTTSSTTQTNTINNTSQQTTGQSDPPSNNNDSGGSGSEGSGGGYGY